jgi:ATP-dependent RNA helicase DDX21
MMFSATIPGWVASIAKKYLVDMKKINLIKEETVRTSETIQHLALMVEEDRRHEAVLDMIQQFNPNNRTIIFTKTKIEANDFIKHFDND